MWQASLRRPGSVRRGGPDRARRYSGRTMPTPATPALSPAVTVLLATHNGARWLDEQLDSILQQQGVCVRIVVSDDASTDGTRELLVERAAADPRLKLLPALPATGSAAANFYRLLTEVDTGDTLVALADQDDIWVPGKLADHSAVIAAGAAGVSSNVLSFDEDGQVRLIRKNHPQRRWDHLLESPGPGSTFLLTPELAALVKRTLLEVPEAREAEYHDWLIYVLARAAGLRWSIQDRPSVRYRQHDSNAMGANVGVGSALSRLRLIGQRWHRGQATLLARVAVTVAPPAERPALQEMADLLADGGLRSRWALARRAGQLRRRPRDRAVIGALIATGVW